jgi:membrane protein CcdC involved in cytochrome C biogenesis
MAWRIRETQRPVTVRKIVVPPLGMSTGLFMFLAPQTRVPVPWAVTAFLLGAFVLSYPLIHTSSLHREGDVVMLKRSPAFLWVLLGLVAVRLAARTWVEQYVDTVQTGSLFFLLAFGMIIRWRVGMYVAYRKIAARA